MELKLAPRDLRECVNELRQCDANNKCFECDLRAPAWASIPYGIIICLKCAGKHRDLGTHISFVKSLTLDSWKKREILCLQEGGNRRARDWLLSSSIAHVPIDRRYSLAQMTEYRESLLTRVREKKKQTDGSPEASPRDLKDHAPSPVLVTGSAGASADDSTQLSPDPGSEFGGVTPTSPDVLPQNKLMNRFRGAKSVSSSDFFNTAEPRGTSPYIDTVAEEYTPESAIRGDYVDSSWDCGGTVLHLKRLFKPFKAAVKRAHRKILMHVQIVTGKSRRYRPPIGIPDDHAGSEPEQEPEQTYE